MIDKLQFVNEMKKALDLPDSYQVNIEEPVCSLTASEIINPSGFDLKLGLQVFHYNLRNKAKLSEQITEVDVIPLKIINEVVSLIKQVEAEYTVNGVTFKMIRVTGGTFLMGSNDGRDNEKPVHEVRVNSFSIGQTQVTQELWKAVMGSNPSNNLESYGKKFPVNCVGWTDCQTFIRKLNQLTGKRFHLPTEAEWEFASRGGIQSKGYRYSGSNNIDAVAWYASNRHKCLPNEPHDVATKLPNELGIYDMSGNGWEWCQDWYDSDYYSFCVVNNPTGPTSGSRRVLRGGGQCCIERDCVVTRRWSQPPEVRYFQYGLRLAL